MKAVGIIVLFGLWAFLAAAVPLEKRALVYVTQTVYDIVDVTTTITVTGRPRTTMATVAHVQATSSSAATTSSSTTTTSSTPPPPPPSTLTSTTATPSPSPAYTWSWSWNDDDRQDTTSTTSTTSSTSQAPVNTPTTSTTPTPVSTPTSTQQPYVAPSPTPSQSSGGSSGSSGGQFHGEITHYDAGLGSCGLTSSASEHVVALSKELMANPPGGNPNKHPNCGRKIKITCNGKTEEATVVDTCSGCKERDVDLSVSLFQIFGHLDEGRKDASWDWVN